MDQSEKRFEQDIESFLISEKGGYITEYDDHVVGCRLNLFAELAYFPRYSVDVAGVVNHV